MLILIVFVGHSGGKSFSLRVNTRGLYFSSYYCFVIGYMIGVLYNHGVVLILCVMNDLATGDRASTFKEQNCLPMFK